MKGKKVVPQVVAGALVTILVWAVREFTQVEIPGEVGAALAVVMAVLVAVITPDEMESE